MQSRCHRGRPGLTGQVGSASGDRRVQVHITSLVWSGSLQPDLVGAPSWRRRQLQEVRDEVQVGLQAVARVTPLQACGFLVTSGLLGHENHLPLMASLLNSAPVPTAAYKFLFRGLAGAWCGERSRTSLPLNCRWSASDPSSSPEPGTSQMADQGCQVEERSYIYWLHQTSELERILMMRKPSPESQGD